MSRLPINQNGVETHPCVLSLKDDGRTVPPPRRKYASLPRAQSRGIYRFLAALLLLMLPAVFAVAQAGEKMSVIEIIGLGKAPVSATNLLALCRKYNVPNSGLYQWKNHLIAYGKSGNIRALRKNLAAIYPTDKVKFYDAPFYQFDRRYCADKTASKAWDNIVLTANLVADESLRKQYLAYHATQFQQWPEVAQGFCNASFQQLLVFKSGRQLMLVISIPHGTNLDELNPKTTQNNPRVNDWNQLMKKYQEGLPGTRPGEVWVFLKPVTAKQLVPVGK